MRIILIAVLVLGLPVSVLAQQGYILTNYETARIVWDYGPVSSNNVPERAIVYCQVGFELFEDSVPYPVTEIRVQTVVPQPRNADYQCRVVAENRAGRSEPSPSVSFSVLRAPEPPSNVRLVQ